MLLMPSAATLTAAQRTVDSLAGEWYNGRDDINEW